MMRLFSCSVVFCSNMKIVTKGRYVEVFCWFKNVSSLFGVLPTARVYYLALSSRKGRLPKLNFVAWESDGIRELDVAHTEFATFGLRMRLAFGSERVDLVGLSSVGGSWWVVSKVSFESK